ncbi:TetR/AcrR family transcriptional regulator [Gordonia sp. 'Campus']|uniref:TetR/AcrR family transcriptional regulator n=1 Tax=Gordonia sp. 'Campus' TaxID=2915824 RepID=UPI001EE4A95D|nr:TetR/AcrR family transcriptional regulator [Gordonia sp. 'Campus']
MPSTPSLPEESSLRPGVHGRSHGSRSEQIVRAATRLFQDTGYRNVGVEQIGAAVGLTGPAVYRHFPSKHDILVRALVTQFDLVEGLVTDAITRGHSPADRLSRFLDGIGHLSARHDVSTLWRREQHHLQPDESGVLRDSFVRLSDRVSAMIADTRPEVSPYQAELLGAAVLSVYATTSGMRGPLPPERLIEVQRAVADAIIACDLPSGPADGHPAPSDRRRRRPTARRERILDAAAQLFSERGFPDVRIDEIARAADISVATLYQEVSGKTEVLRAVLWRGVDGIMYVSTHALDGVSDADALDALIGVFVEYSLGVHGRIMPVFTRDLMYLPEADQARLRAGQLDHRALWIDAIRFGDTALSPADANALAQALFGVTGEVIESPRLRARAGIVAEVTALARAALAPAGLGRPSPSPSPG